MTAAVSGAEVGRLESWLALQGHPDDSEFRADVAAVLAQLREGLADKARLDWLEARAFTVYRVRDPFDGKMDHVTVVDEDKPGTRRGILGPTTRTAIDNAMRGEGL